MSLTPSAEQRAAIQFVEEGEGNGIITAVAGSGKTSTLMMVLPRLEGDTIMVAFNKSIATEIGNRITTMGLSNSVEAKTVHSCGMRSLFRVTGRTLDLSDGSRSHRVTFPQKLDVQGSKYREIIKPLVRQLNLDEETQYEVQRMLSRIIDLVRLNLVNPKSESAVRALASKYGMMHQKYLGYVYDIMSQGMKQFREDGIIDFADMIYLPVRFGLPIAKYDWVLVDECQDLSALQLEFVKRLGGDQTRYLFVGDRNQAIYGFAGADHDSFNKIISDMDCHEMTLTTCYRCSKTVIEEVHKIKDLQGDRLVPQIHAMEGASLGSVLTIEREDYLSLVGPGDLTLCRLNAPMIYACLHLVSMGLKASIRGRELGSTLKSFVKRVSKRNGFTWDLAEEFMVEDVRETIEYLARIGASDSTKAGVLDIYEAALFVYQACGPIKSVYPYNEKVDQLFRFREDDPSVSWLSSIHRAKGLEAKSVYLLAPDRLPLRFSNQRPEEFLQELNLKYVAQTRAKEDFCYVKDDESSLDLKEALDAVQTGEITISQYLLERST